MNKIWVIIVSICIIFGLATGNTEAMVEASLNVPKDTLDLLIKVGGLIIFYNGLFQIAIDSGLIRKLAKIFYPLTKKIFKDLKKDSQVHEYISANLIANLLGLGIASTPIALKALRTMQAELRDQEKPSRSMVILVLMNVAAFTVFPLTILSVRRIYEAKINLELVPFFIISSLILSIIAIILGKFWGREYE